eukprot:GHVP01068408.1.p1 GENE.GHVP01068408.1~~GHVP01068408.1.p1  ORF type:complete len:375 (+),score=81.55 GHVP01068408.1:921-2045(+)
MKTIRDVEKEMAIGLMEVKCKTRKERKAEKVIFEALDGVIKISKEKFEKNGKRLIKINKQKENDIEGLLNTFGILVKLYRDTEGCGDCGKEVVPEELFQNKELNKKEKSKISKKVTKTKQKEDSENKNENDNRVPPKSVKGYKNDKIEDTNILPFKRERKRTSFIGHFPEESPVKRQVQTKLPLKKRSSITQLENRKDSSQENALSISLSETKDKTGGQECVIRDLEHDRGPKRNHKENSGVINQKERTAIVVLSDRKEPILGMVVEENGDTMEVVDSDKSGKQYTVSRKNVVLLHEENADAKKSMRFKRGDRVYGKYPDTTCFYPGTVITPDTNRLSKTNFSVCVLFDEEKTTHKVSINFLVSYSLLSELFLN